MFATNTQESALCATLTDTPTPSQSNWAGKINGINDLADTPNAAMEGKIVQKQRPARDLESEALDRSPSYLR
jgi:hypothetical protein